MGSTHSGSGIPLASPSLHKNVTQTPNLKCGTMKADMTSSPKETHKYGHGRDLFAVGLVQHVSESGMMWAHILGLLNASAGGEDRHSLCRR